METKKYYLVEECGYTCFFWVTSSCSHAEFRVTLKKSAIQHSEEISAYANGVAHASAWEISEEHHKAFKALTFEKLRDFGRDWRNKNPKPLIFVLGEYDDDKATC
jgi:hypothetical protein